MNSNDNLGEQLEIKVTENEINIRGTSFYTELLWKNIFKVDEVTNYFLIYKNSLSVIIIAKKDLSKLEIAALKKILTNIRNVPVQLKDTA